MAKELAKQYDPRSTEDRIYQTWCDKGYFHTQIDRSKKPFTIVMPPPNVTGQLHMGHAMDETWQDILTRYKRMQGYAALWVPGTDHASIATEAKVVAEMAKEGLTKDMLGRDGFLERAWAWKNQYGSRIVSQLKKLGCSCDWQRERFTMDEGCSEAVLEVFVNLYNKGLIYRGNRMVNWCPHCNTSISDAEVEYAEKPGHFWHLLYPVKETGEMLELATTRPETMLGDTAVAINTEDERYAHLHGCHVVLPLVGREIPIVCDEHADMEKGTGVVKITPAHDPNDFEVGQRHDLPMVRVLTYEGHMTGAADRAAWEELKASGHILNHQTAGHPHTLEGQVLRLSDKLAYIYHDMDDAIRGGILTEEDIPTDIRKVLGSSCKERLNRMVHDVITTSMDRPEICMSPAVERAMADLRRFMFDNVYLNPKAKGEEDKAVHMIEQLFDYYMKHPEALPEQFRKSLELTDISREQVVCDYIAGMTDSYAVKKFQDYFVPESWKI